jgi:hypothetical protein
MDAEDNEAPAGTRPGTPTETLFNLARGAKGIALLCFALPWVTVSCAQQPLAKITGLQLATGSVRPIGQGMPGGPGAPGGGAAAAGQNFSLDIFALAAALIIAGALVATFVMARRRGALVAMAGSALAALIIAFDVLVRIKGAATDRIRQSAGGFGDSTATGPGAEFEAQMKEQLEQITQQISVDPAIGFWLCVLALVAAVVLNNMVRMRTTEP